MKRIVIALLAFGLLTMPTGRVYASHPNGALMLQIIFLTGKSKSVLSAQRNAQAMIAGGHVYVGREVNATTKFQRKFSEYLDSLQDVIIAGANLYGAYMEVKKTTKLIGEVNSVLSSAPENSIALTLYPGRNRIYSDIVNTSTSIGMDIYNICISKAKRTEHDIYKTMADVRKKLHKLNDQLSTLAIYLRYTSFEKVADLILNEARFINKKTKADLIEKCRKRWAKNMIVK